MNIWEIKLNSDECQYCEPPFQPDGSYLCRYPGGKNWGKECLKELCPIASQQGVEAGVESRCIFCKEVLPRVDRCPKCSQDQFRTA